MFKKTVVPWCLLFAALSTPPLSLQAQISVSRSIVEFSPDKKVQDIEVFNSGEHKIFLDMNAVEIVEPESDNPTRVAMDDPRTAPLLITPKQLLVPSGERRRFRVLLRENATDKDRIYRLAVKPYAGSVEVESNNDQEKVSAIKVLVGYDLLLLSRPQDPVADVRVSREDDSIVFSNKGNTNVLLRRIEQCDAQGEQCVELPANRLYAGESYTLSLPFKGDADQFPVTVWKAVGLQNSKALY